MYLIHEATIRNCDGVYDIHVRIVNGFKAKNYIYNLSSEWAAQRFHYWYRKGREYHGMALTVLNKFKIKEEKK